MPTLAPEGLLAPISPEHPGGADLALTLDLDAIRKARQGDDGGLAQGEWVRALKIPQWPQVRDLCEAILKSRSKVLQVACWYAEALTMLDGFQGLTAGLQVLEGLLERFWPTCHPVLEGTFAEERAGRFEWLDNNLPLAVKQIPITEPGAGGFTWLHWEEARNVDNLGLRNPQAKEEAIGEGKLAGEVFQKAVLASGPAFFATLQGEVLEALTRCGSLQAALDHRFGPEGPGLVGLAQALQNCLDFVTQTRQRNYSAPTPERRAAPPPVPALPLGSPTVHTRSDAIATLRATAAFFRAAEPQSPVALLVERAANWAEMPLDAWLNEVIKDQATLAQLRELLNLKTTTMQLN